MELRNVVFHLPGPRWQQGVGFRDQPGIMAHVQHYARLLGEGKLLLGGPFVDPDAGGMMIATADVTREDLEAFAASDPAVQAELIIYEIRTWYVAMANQDFSDLSF